MNSFTIFFPKIEIIYFLKIKLYYFYLNPVFLLFMGFLHIFDFLSEKFNIFKNNHIEESFVKKISDLKEEQRNKFLNKNDNSKEEKLLSDIIGFVRRNVNDIWFSDETLENKKSQIYKMFEEVNLLKAIPNPHSKSLLKKFEDRALKYKNEKKNKNMANHHATYETVPRITNLYSNMSLKNYNRDVKLILNDMTKNKNTIFVDIENRYNVRKDILESLKKTIPEAFRKGCGFKAIKFTSEKEKEDNPHTYLDNFTEAYMNSRFKTETKVNLTELSQGRIDSKYDPERPMINSSVEDQGHQVSRRTISKFEK